MERGSFPLFAGWPPALRNVRRRGSGISLGYLAVHQHFDAVFLGLGAIGLAGMWEAVIADVGVAILAIFNALRAMR